MFLKSVVNVRKNTLAIYFICTFVAKFFFYMDALAQIQKPIKAELDEYRKLFEKALTHDSALLGNVLQHIRSRKGKMMRPMLVLLAAKWAGGVNASTLHAAVTLEVLHTASLVHDDVVDESAKRRGQLSVNAAYNNKVAVLVGDYLLSTALIYSAFTNHIKIVEKISLLGQTLSEGELLQLSNVSKEEIVSEESYFQVISKKTAALFAACGEIGAISAGNNPEIAMKTRRFGEIVGICFQIRDDIFDYYTNAAIGKPTGNDLREGKLTLPVLYALRSTGDERMRALAFKVKEGEVNDEEIHELVEFTKAHGGIEYAERKMEELRQEAYELLNDCPSALQTSLKTYIDFCIERKK